MVPVGGKLAARHYPLQPNPHYHAACNPQNVVRILMRMARISLYVADANQPKVRKLKDICMLSGASMSEWFMRAVEREIKAQVRLREQRPK